MSCKAPELSLLRNLAGGHPTWMEVTLVKRLSHKYSSVYSPI